MRIVAVTPLYPPTSRVGSWLSTHELLRYLAHRGHDVHVAVQMGETRSYDLDGVHVHVGAHNIEQLVPTADVAVSHVGDRRRGHTAALAADVPSVRMVHGEATDADLDGAALVVFNSDASRAESAWAGPSVTCRPVVWADQHRTTPGDRVTLVNLSEPKGGQIFWQLAERLPDLRFLGVKGGYGTQVKPRARNIDIIGTQTDMREVWSRTRVLVMPSAAETWGRVGVEAMASGIPVVAHPTPGLRESLGGAGIFVDRDDLAGWVTQVRRLVTRPHMWRTASSYARRRSAELDPTEDLVRFEGAVIAHARKGATL